MPYEVKFTDDLNKSPIVVEDVSINSETSISIPGKRYPGYGQVIAENFLHILENFANNTSPDKPIEGQLWYDNTDGVDQLKIYDGTNWITASGLKKGNTEPELGNSTVGDLWVNTDTQQLYLFSGAAWVLVGPEFSDGLLTGLQSETITSADNTDKVVITFKIQDKTVGIFSSEEFTPKTVIPGFASRQGKPVPIKVGLTLYDEGPGKVRYKFAGIAEQAEGLTVVGETEPVPAAEFVRNNQDIPAILSSQLKVNTDAGLTLGSNGQFGIAVQNQSVVLKNITNGSSINFNLRSGNRNNTVLTVDAEQAVGVNNPSPEESLDVNGNVQISAFANDNTTGNLFVNGIADTTGIGTGSLVVQGGASIGLNFLVGGATELQDTVTTADIQPNLNNSRNIGTINTKFDQIFANTFLGNLQGNVIGSVTGRADSADRLTSATIFTHTTTGSSVSDVEFPSFEFDGTGGTKEFNFKVRDSFITNKEEIFDSPGTDEIVISRPSGLFKVSKTNFIKSIPVTPPGIISPYGGQDAPNGWLLCNGAVVSKTEFVELFQAIGYSFLDPSNLPDQGINSFALPDLRGRMPLGLDNLGGVSANRVTDPSADSIGSFAGDQEKDISKTNLPDHEHDLRGNAGGQYYAVRAGTNAADTDAVDLSLESGTLGAQGITNSGGIVNGGETGNNDYREIESLQEVTAGNFIIGVTYEISFVGTTDFTAIGALNNVVGTTFVATGPGSGTGSAVTTGIVERLAAPLNVMNPYLSLNYIIYTGK